MIVPKSVTFAAGGQLDLNKLYSVNASAFKAIKFIATPSGSTVEVYFLDAKNNKTSPFKVVPGDVYNLADSVVTMFMQSDTAGTVSWQQSEVDNFKTAQRYVTIDPSSAAFPARLVNPSNTVVTADASVAATTASSISTNVASGTQFQTIRVELEISAPGPVRVRTDAAANATQGLWLYPGGSLTFKSSALTLVGFIAYSVYNPNAVAVNVHASTEVG